MIEFKNVSFRYSNEEGAPYALADISLNISRGELAVVVGANGSGKSTMARLLNCLLVPTAGKVFIDGMDTSADENIWKIRKKVGFVFQNPENQIVGTVVENDVAFAPENLGLPESEIEERVSYALEAVGLIGRREFMTAHLSGGQKQRLAIAGVLAMKPDILVLDEPTAMLDARGRDSIIRLILKIKNELKITVVLITHFMENALIGDKLICLEDGFARYAGAPHAFFMKGGEFISKFNLKQPFAYELLNILGERGIRFAERDYIRASDPAQLGAIIMGAVKNAR
ncbi:MAG: Energy-coupling factor transporter ATP-binding protein EcfA1 [bacterium ADurb.Bin243]|nr:MAG: Energy-coupling factor transporter ATP-binding protein EcfA1 [bacterium ADurb.Bin243]